MNAKILEVRPDRVREAIDQGSCRWSAAPRACRPTATSPSSAAAVRHDRGALAHALGADACELYTDVSGVFTTDPRVVPEAAACPQSPSTSCSR